MSYCVIIENFLCYIMKNTNISNISAGLFALAGVYQMTVWAIAKHRNYKKEFPDYPRGRKAIIPFII